MKYLDFIKTALPAYIVTEEVNYQYNGVGTALIIKYLPGANYLDSKVQGVQLSVYTDDPVTTREELDAFTKAYNNNPYYDVTDYIKQIYSPPTLMTPFDYSGSNYAHQFIITGTLIISSNVSEIKSVSIDGVQYETTTRDLAYATQPDNQRVSNEEINTTHITYANLTFACSMIHKDNLLMQKIARIRKGLQSIDSSFSITLTFSNNDIQETYEMKLQTASLNSENQSLPIMSLSFIK